MSQNILHVIGVPLAAGDEDLGRAFMQFGTVISARIVRDIDGNSIGFGIVEMDQVSDVEEVLSTKDRLQIGGTRLQVWKRPASR